MAETTTRFPDYVTDGHHIYLWNDEYEQMLLDGKLKECGPPEVPKKKVLSAREKTKLEEIRKKALRDAEEAVRLYKNAAPSSEELFGSEPRDE